ncbi:MAG TPA: carboxypeptidase-like regulatory domain-containing protein, partial [Gemmatimonas sp.]|nr:carboxypeptidase-like regulatory domain-containing protein [Gemmatimonas sp.]
MTFPSLVVLVLLLVTPLASYAQAADIVRGRVMDDSSRALSGAAVTITRGPDRLVQQSTTDANGRYSSRFEPGTGDYLVNVSAVGFQTARRRVQSLNGERDIVGDFTLARDLTTLATVKVTADKPVRATNRISPTTAETGASEQWSNGVQGRVTPGSAGDLNAIAGTIPGVTMTSSGPSILGAASSSNLTTLNGMALPGGSIPRAAQTETRVTGATFDATRGGFAGANIDVRLAPGSREYQQRNAFFTVDAPQLQMTDAVGRSLGLVNRGFRGSIGADGEAIRQVLTYNTSLEVANNVSTPSTLLGGDADAWRRAGVSPDSVNRLVSLASVAGIPLGGSGVPELRNRNGFTWLGRFDDIRDSLRALTLTTYASYNREGALGFGPLSSPAAGGKSTDQVIGAQFYHTTYVGPLRYVMVQNRLALSDVRQRVAPYRSLPGATVLVRSASDAAASDVAALSLGGNPRLATDDRRWTAEGSSDVTWMARGSKHRFRSQLWARADGLTQEGEPNRLGQYTFNSLADFAANRPASYSRTIDQPVRSATTYNGAVALVHQWNKSRWFNLMYGARVEANAFGNAPPQNVALENALGVESGLAPARIHVSPRLGFSYTYSRAKDNGSGTNMNQVGRFYRTTMGYIRGGVGEFRDLYRPDMLADAIGGAGITGSTLSLSCVGAAVPIPDWSTLTSNAGALPIACADGTTALGERAPSVTLLDRSFDVPRSWRGSLSWGSSFGRWMAKVDALGSYDLARPSTIDANFGGTPRFALDGEGGRPVFVSAAAIDAGTGSVSPREARRSTDFGRVALRTSDLKGYGGQITTTVQPDVFRNRSRISFFTSASYTLQRTLQQFRGSDGGNVGDPREREWASGANDARHAIVFQGGVNLPVVGTVTAFTRLQSGLPFTPVVQGDIDGDGRGGDRAFVPAAGGTTTDAALRAQMGALLTAAPGNVRECLTQQANALAGRNSCRGPWTQQLNVQWTPRIPIRVQGRRIVTNIVFDNPLGGIDQLVNGADGMKGWGTRAMPDPVLLVPRGFDASTRAFRYDVNPRFGDTRAFRTLSRQPFRVTIDFSMNFSTPYDVQQIRRALEPVKVQGRWERRSADSITAYYLRNTSSVHKMLLAESDSLFLNKTQIETLLAADSVFGVRVREIYRPLGEYLAAQPNGVPGKAALDSANASDKLYWKVFWEQVDVMAPVITPLQRQLMPMLVNIIGVSKEDRLNLQWQFGYPVTVTHSRPRVGG